MEVMLLDVKLYVTGEFRASARLELTVLQIPFVSGGKHSVGFQAFCSYFVMIEKMAQCAYILSLPFL